MSSENNSNIPVKKVVRRKKVRRNVDNLINNSGKGDVQVVKVVSDRFNWSAFFIPVIWGFFNKANKAFYAIIPGFFLPIFFEFFSKSIPELTSSSIYLVCSAANFGFCLWCGIKGNTWAWQGKRYESIEHFHYVQKKWAIGSILAIFILPIIFIAVFGQAYSSRI